MHHVVLDRWSRGRSALHRRDARAKLAGALLLLIAVATTPTGHYAAVLIVAAVLVATAAVARLPVFGVAWRAGFVLPFSLTFAAMSWISGDAARAASLLIKSYTSALAVVLLLGTTSFPDLARAIEWTRAPRLPVLLAQFVYRYLFVISEQAQHMWQASLCRARRSGGFGAAAGALGVLFARSYQRAEGIQNAMAARGFNGHFRALALHRFGAWDALLVVLTAALAVGVAWNR